MDDDIYSLAIQERAIQEATLQIIEVQRLIENKNNVELESSLIDVFSKYQSVESLFPLLNTLISYSYQLNNSDSLVAIFNAAEDVSNYLWDCTIKTQLLTTFVLDEELVSVLLDGFPNETLVSYVYELTQLDDRDDIFVALDRLVSYFGNCTERDIEQIDKILIEQDYDQKFPNIKVKKWLRGQKRLLSFYKEKPEYVRVDTQSIDDLQIGNEVISNESVKLLEEDGNDVYEIDTSKINSESTFQRILSKARDVVIASELYLDLLDNIARFSISNNIHIFRLYGPCNLRLGFPIDPNHPCSYLGGCRMLICRCFVGGSDITDEDYFRVDWFKGYCDYCDIAIRDRIHAYRRGLIEGGWMGCYCSKDCCINDIKYKNKADVTINDYAWWQLTEYGLYSEGIDRPTFYLFNNYTRKKWLRNGRRIQGKIDEEKDTLRAMVNKLFGVRGQ